MLLSMYEPEVIKKRLNKQKYQIFKAMELKLLVVLVWHKVKDDYEVIGIDILSIFSIKNVPTIPIIKIVDTNENWLSK